MKHKQLLAALLCAVTPLTHAETAGSLDEVVVTATRVAQPLNQSLAHTTVINQKEIQASQAVDVPSLLKNLAGVEIYQSGGIGKQSSLFMRGSNSSHTLVLLDGVRIGSATTGSTAIDQIMLDQIERIEVVRGNVSSLYGSEAIGGVTQIFTKRGKGAPSFNVSGGAGTHSTQRAAAGFGGEVMDTSFSVQASKFRTDGVSAINPLLATNANPDKDGYDNTSISANIHHAFSADHGLRASVFESDGRVQNDDYGFFALPSDLHDSHTTLSKLSLSSDNRFGEVWQSKLLWAQGKDDLRNFTNGLPVWDIKSTSNQLDWQNTLQFGEQQILLGIDSLQQRVASNTAYTQLGRRVSGLFAGYTGLHGGHQLQLNVRQDRYSDFGTSDTWLAGYGYEVSNVLRATASLGTAFKAPTFNDMYAPVAWGGNPALRPEQSRNKEIGLHYNANEQRMDATYFENQVVDLIEYKFPLTQNISQARMSGWELAYDGQFGDTNVKAALTLQNPRDSQTGQTLLRRAKSFYNINVARQFGAWRAGGEWQHSGARADVDINTFARTTLASYDVINLSASYALDRQLNMSLRVDNLLNKDYMLAHGYNTLGRTLFVGLSYQQ